MTAGQLVTPQLMSELASMLRAEIRKGNMEPFKKVQELLNTYTSRDGEFHPIALHVVTELTNMGNRNAA